MRNDAMVTAARLPLRVRSERSRASRRRVIDATIACIAEEGLVRASTTRIAKRAGVTWGVLQHQFGDKAGMLEAVVDRVLEYAASMADPEAVTRGTIAERVAALERLLWRGFQSPTYRALLEIQLHFGHGDLEDLADRAARGLDRARDDLARRWLEDAGISRRTSRSAVAVLIGALRGLALEVITSRRSGRFEKERKVIVDAVVRTLGDDEGSGRKRKGTR
jgi:AcrR family transcriptional regulator